MADEASRYGASSRAGAASGWAVGGTMFASVMMIVAGIWQSVAGLIAIFENEFYLAPATTSSSSTPPAGAGSTCWSACS